MTTTHSNEPHPEEAIASRLLRFKDELVVRGHLAGMEADDVAHLLTRELDALASFFRDRVVRRASATSHEAKEQMYLQLLSNDQRLLEVEASFKAAFARAASSAAAVVETARLKAALARMDAKDAAEKERKVLQHDLAEIETKTTAVLKNIDDRLTKLSVETSKIV